MSGGSKRVLVTGPVGRVGEYSAAARAAGWAAEELELIRVEPVGLDPDDLPKWIDLACVTSKHAVPSLRALLPGHHSVPVAVVGEGTADAVRELGFAIEHGPARTAVELGAALREHLRDGAVVLWPRGSQSDDLARILRRSGAVVHDPIVYRTVPATPDRPLPACDAVFFASPSAVAAFRDRADRAYPKGRVAIAIGPTTAAALRDSSLELASIVPLESPTARAFARCLRDLSVPS